MSIVADQFSGFLDDLLTEVSKSAMKKLFRGGVVPSSKQRRKLQPQRTGHRKMIDDGIDLGNNVTYYPAPTTNRSGRK